MARYRVRYVSYAAEQLSQLPRSFRITFEARVEDLKRDPYVAGDYLGGYRESSSAAVERTSCSLAPAATSLR